MIKVTIESILPDWWGADDCFNASGADAVSDMIFEDTSAFLEDATVKIEQLSDD